ncbi:MAG: AraC family transcriptional regulator [Clostridiales bacterium]|nr:AraC family transcriptional regulator [Clostridiales bacterium]
MKSVLYIRELPNGNRQIFDSPGGFRTPAGPYFDDIAMNRADGGTLVSMKYGHEQSAPDRIIKDRLAKDYIFHYILGGKGRYNGKELTANQGFLIFPDEIHTIEADMEEPWYFLWLAIRGYNIDYLIKNAGFSSSRRIFQFGDAGRVFEIFNDVIYTPHPDADMEMYMLSCFYRLISYLKSESRQIVQRGMMQSESYHLQAKQFMQKNFARDISIADVADSLNISRKYLTGIFNKYEECSPQMYLTNLRLDIASTLLRETLAPITEIARLVGYSDYAHFYKIFKKHKNLSPSKYREGCQ